ncbi:high affinity copper uptake 1-like [Brachionus plicatilis]|uniref:Copper transport protein n=1 Tax=Brachionus plicatilis TaxID=10195 RepID=A0A3M7QVZ9_BRAPC|nr:high affinity copper uptake 1-like [Brachionus plicatilis]
MADDLIQKSAEIVTNVIAATTKCSKHKHEAVDHSAHMAHGPSHSLHDGMIMTFHGGYDEVILFDFWKTTDSVSLFIVSCLILFVMAALYEGLKLLREGMLRAEMASRREANAPQNKAISENQNLIENNNQGAAVRINQQDPEIKSYSSKLLSKGHIIQSFMHMLQITVSYLLMLVFMTYNSWLCLSVVLGAGLGYFLFGLKRITAVDLNEHCH